MRPVPSKTESGVHISPDLVTQWVLSRQHQITSYARMIVRDTHLAEDIFQEICLAAISARSQFDSPEGTVRWAMKVARNKAIDQLRRRKAHACPFSPELLDRMAEDWLEAASKQDEEAEPVFEQLEECLDQLTPRAREMLRLRYGEGRKPSEIAALQGHKIQAVYKTITRANAAVKDCMKHISQTQP